MRYFIDLGSSIAKGRIIARKRMQQVNDLTEGADPVYVDIEFHQPKIV